MECMIRAYALVQHRCDRIVVGGFSLGGVLAALLAAEHRDEVAGLFTINAPLRLRNRLAPLVPAVLQLDRALKTLRSSRDLTRRRNDSESPDTNYDMDYLGSVRELRRAIALCRKRLRLVTAPTLIIQTEDDPVVIPGSADILERGLASTARIVTRLPGDRHIIVRGPESRIVFDEVSAFLERLWEADAARRAARTN
jgi:esterase/lipase